MKRTAYFLLLFGSTALLSCNPMERDAEHVAELTCQAQKAAVGVLTGEASASEVRKLRREADKIRRDMEGKYTTLEEKKEFARLLLQKMGDCD